MIINRYGAPEEFQFADIDTPKIEDDEILVKVQGSSVNPVDCAIRSGLLKSFIRIELPAVLGVDVSGEVVEVGKNVSRFKRGDTAYAFMGIKRNGSYGEYAAVPESYATHTPRNIGLVEAGVVPGVGMTALEAFKAHAPLANGQHVLINGAAGGVGTFAIQIAKSMGAEVTAVCSAGKTGLVKQLGADHIIDYTKQDIHAITQKFEVILNCVRGISSWKLRKLLKPRGKLVDITGSPLQIPLLKVFNWFFAKKSIVFFVRTDGHLLQDLTTLIEEGKVKPVIEKVFSWKELAQAHRRCETGRVAGKIAIAVNEG